MTDYLPISPQRRRELLERPLPVAPKPARTLKIEEALETNGNKTQVKPYIRLRGKWLEKAGFKPGQRVEVRTFEFNPGQILLVATNV